MAERHGQAVQRPYTTSIEAGRQGARVTSDGGVMVVRELDERLGFGARVGPHLADSRRGQNTQSPLADLMRPPLEARLAGDEEVNDAERLSHDPTVWLIGSEKSRERRAAQTSGWQPFKTTVLPKEKNFAGLAAIDRALIARVEAIGSPQGIVLDLDSTESPVDGRQEQSADGGHSASTCKHPLRLFCHEGDCPASERQPQPGKAVAFRADAAFAKREIDEAACGSDPRRVGRGTDAGRASRRGGRECHTVRTSWHHAHDRGSGRTRGLHRGHCRGAARRRFGYACAESWRHAWSAPHETSAGQEGEC